MRSWKAAAVALVVLMAVAARAIGGPVDGPDLAEVRAAMADPTIPLAERALRALDGASMLDQAASRSTSPADRRARWSEAVALLDEFVAKNPGGDPAPGLRFQAGVYRWAEGRSFDPTADLSLADSPARVGPVRALDDAIRRLRSVAISPPGAGDLFAQNVRFRLAQAIADRARFEPEGDAARLASEREAIGLLDPPMTAPGLRGHARLLRAELACRLGLFGQARMEIEEAEKADPPPPAADLLVAKVAALAGREQYAEASRAVETSQAADEALKGSLRLRIRLAKRRAVGPGAERNSIDAEAFAAAMALRPSDRPEARRAPIELARAIDEPPPESPEEWWDLLAEGHLRMGDPARAARLDARAADRAEAMGRADRAASLRFKSGGCLFQAEKFAEADRALSRVVAAGSAPRDLRARAGMLRAIARGRDPAARQPGPTRASYIEALEQQVRDFPDEPATGEARWLLGQVRDGGGRRDEAVTLWAGIEHSHPRWLEARLLVDDLLRDAVEGRRIGGDPAAARSAMDEALKAHRAALASALDGPETVALTLRLIRLDLTPGVGRPAEAVDASDRLLRRAARPEEHGQARLYRMVGLAQMARAGEAELIARTEARTATPADLLPAIRLLDRSASEMESDSLRRRLGLILKILTARLPDRLDQQPAAARDEARLRIARALLFAGEPDAARRELSAWGGPMEAGDEDVLRDLADLYLRLDAFTMVVEVERIRAKRLAPGSRAWFEARYGLALAYYRSGKGREARQIIDATSILHPDLGGGDLRPRFERLRQKLGQE